MSVLGPEVDPGYRVGNNVHKRHPPDNYSLGGVRARHDPPATEELFTLEELTPKQVDTRTERNFHTQSRHHGR